MLAYLKIMEWKLIYVFATPNIVRKIKNANYKGYVHDKYIKKLNCSDTRHAKSIIESFKLKRLEKIKTEEPITRR